MEIGTIEKTISKLEKEKDRIDAALKLLNTSKEIIEDVEKSIMSVMYVEVEEPKRKMGRPAGAKNKKKKVGRPAGKRKTWNPGFWTRSMEHYLESQGVEKTAKKYNLTNK